MTRPLPPCLRLDGYERERPTGPDGRDAPVRSRLNDVHDYFRAVIDQLNDLIQSGAESSVETGRGSRVETRGENGVASSSESGVEWGVEVGTGADLPSVRANLAALACRQYCADLVSHHRREDGDIFPALAASSPELAAVLTRLEAEHTGIDQAIRLVHARTFTATTPADRGELRALVHALGDVVESHFRYEESELGRAMNTADRPDGAAPYRDSSAGPAG